MAKAEDQVFDVSRPGKTPAHATSRPLIVTGRTILKRDPMMSGQTNIPVTGSNELIPTSDTPDPMSLSSLSESHPHPEPPKPETIVSPTMLNEAKAQQEAIMSVEEGKQPVPSQAAPEKTQEVSEEKPVEEESTEEEPEEPPVKKPENKPQPVAEAVAKQEKNEKIIADKTYFVPVGQTKKSSMRLIVIILVVIAVAVAAGYIALR